MSNQTNRHSLSIRSATSESAEEKNSATLTSIAAIEIPEKSHTISDDTDIYTKDIEEKELRLEDRFVVNFYDTTNNSNVEVQCNPETANNESGKKVHYRKKQNTTSAHCLNRIKPSPQTLSTVIIPIVIFLLGIIMGTAVFFVILGQERRRYRTDFDYYCDERKNAIVSGFWKNLATARDFCAFLSVTPSVNTSIVNRYGNFSSMTTMNIRSVNFAPLVNASDRLTWERDNGIIMKQLSGSQLVTRDYNATIYFPLQYISPWRGEESTNTIGYDAYSQPERQKSIDMARQTKNVSITSKVQLAFNTSVTGVLVFFPFYKNLADPKIIPPNKDVDGLVIGVYDVVQSFGKILSQFQDVGLSIKIFDRGYDSLIYDSSILNEKYQDDFYVERVHNFADRSWRFQCIPTKYAYNHSVQKTMPSVSLVLFTLFFGLLGFLTSRYFRKYLNARDKVSIQTLKLGRTQSLLKAITADSKAVLEAIADPLVALNAKGEIVGANKHALRLTGYSPDDIEVRNRMHINQLLIPVVETPAEEREISDYDPMQVPVRPGMRDVMARRKDGSCFEAEANFSQQVVEKNYFTQVVMFRDVSFKKEHERAVIEAKREAEIANQSKTEFLFFLCHEIRNPIHAIFGFAEMLKNSFKEKEQEELDYIMSAGKFLSFIVNDILDLTHLTNPNPYEIELKCEQFDLHILIPNVAKIQSIQAANKKINLKTVLHSDIPHSVYGDARRLEQVINKLLARSIEVTPEGGIIELEIQVLRLHRSRGVLLRFLVKDESEGLSSDKEISELFKPYSRSNSSIGSRFHAQGLSMALAQAIVKIMGGKLQVDKSNKKRPGNRVWFDIWLLTEDNKPQDNFNRESFDTVISRSGSGLNSKKDSPTNSTDETHMDTLQETDTTTEFKTQILSSKSMSKSKYLDRPYKTTLRKKRRSPLSGGDESDDGSNIVKGNFFQRKGSIMLAATGLSRSSSLHQNNKTSNEESTNNSVDNTMSSSPIITYYSGNERQNDFENLSEETKPNFTQEQILNNRSTPPISPMSPMSPMSPKSPTFLNTQNLTSGQHSIIRDEHSNKHINIPNSPVQIKLPSPRLVSITPPSSSHAAQPPLSTTTLDQTHTTSLQTENNIIDSSNVNVTSSTAPLSLPTLQICQAEQISSSSQPLKILLVEDNLICQRVTSKMLIRNNYSVDIANNGKEAIEMVEKTINMVGYSCILMDIITPVMNGYEATKLLRDQGVDIPILALTANSFGSDFKKAMDVGMDAFLTKPIKEEELVSVIKKEIEKYTSRQYIGDSEETKL